MCPRMEPDSDTPRKGQTRPAKPYSTGFSPLPILVPRLRHEQPQLSIMVVPANVANYTFTDLMIGETLEHTPYMSA